MAGRVPTCRNCGGVPDQPEWSETVEYRNCGARTHVKGRRS